jgi:undecaprenyl-diphosphatase
MNQFDLSLYHAINGLAGSGSWFDGLMAFFAQYGLEIYAALFLAAWFALPKSEEKKRHQLVISFFAGVLALLINFVISHIWYRQRPFIVLPKGDYTQLIPHSADASFPSDHTSGSFAFAAGAWGGTSKWVSHSFMTLAFIEMFSRVYCGVHWPTDVLGGLVVGVFSGVIVRYFSKWIQPITNIGLRIFRFGHYSRKEVVQEKQDINM